MWWLWLLITVGVLLTIGELLLWLVVVPRARRRNSARRARLEAWAAPPPGQTILRGPEPGSYRGRTAGPYPRVQGDGTIQLTTAQLRFRKVTGGEITVELTDVLGTRFARGWHGEIRAGMPHLVVLTNAGEVGYFVRDVEAWRTAI